MDPAGVSPASGWIGAVSSGGLLGIIAGLMWMLMQRDKTLDSMRATISELVSTISGVLEAQRSSATSSEKLLAELQRMHQDWVQHCVAVERDHRQFLDALSKRGKGL